MESKTSVEVCQSSLARRLAEWRPSIICIDVEGAELDLLSPGLPDFVERLVVEVHEPVYGLRESTGRFGSSPRSDSCMSPELRTAR